MVALSHRELQAVKRTQEQLQSPQQISKQLIDNRKRAEALLLSLQAQLDGPRVEIGYTRSII